MKNPETLKQIMHVSFDDAVKKSGLDAATARMEAIDMFGKVLGWEEDTNIVAVMLSLTTEVVTTAHFFTRKGTPQDHIKFIDNFAESVKSQVRAKYDKSK